MEITTIGIDLAKSVFAVSGADSSGRVIVRRQLRRAQVLSFMRGLPRCTIGIEASGGAQYWARQLSTLGHEVRLMSPALVMPYRKGNKTDRNDADAILEAVSRPSMRFVTVKSVAQQDLLALHRVRAQLVKSRTALCNQLRGLLRERGVTSRRILISDHLFTCVRSVEPNLIEARLHLIEAMDLWQRESDFHARAVSVTTDGSLKVQLPERRCPLDEIRPAMSMFHTVGFIRV